MKGNINDDNLMWSMMFLFSFSLNLTSNEDASDCSSGLVNTQVLSAVWTSLCHSSLWFCRGCWLLSLSFRCSLFLSLLCFLFLDLLKDLKGRKYNVNNSWNTNHEIYKKHWGIFGWAELRTLPYCRRPFWPANVGWPADNIQEGTCMWFQALDTPSRRNHNESFSEPSAFSSSCRWPWASIFCWLYPDGMKQKRFWKSNPL